MNIESSNRLKNFRNFLKIKQEEMAIYLGIGREAYSSIETGKNGIKDEHLHRLLDKGLNLNWLFTGTGEMLLNSDLKSIQIGAINTGIAGSVNHTYNTVSDCEKDLAVMEERLSAARREIELKDEIISLLKNK